VTSLHVQAQCQYNEVPACAPFGTVRLCCLWEGKRRDDGAEGGVMIMEMGNGRGFVLGGRVQIGL